jgi:hypothetical protein
VILVLFSCVVSPGFVKAQDTEALKKIVVIQQARLEQLARKLEAAEAEMSKVKTSADRANSAAATAQTAADNAAAAAREASQRAQASLPVKGVFDGTQFPSCDSKCASLGMRCLTGQANPVASSFAVSCAQATNVCICTVV